MNIDFNTDPGFSFYVVLLAASGAVMFVMAALRGSSRGMRIANTLFGLGFMGYAFYLAFIFDGGTYFIFFKVFIVPVLLVVNTIRSISARRQAAAAQAAHVQTQAYNQAQYQAQQAAAAQQAQASAAQQAAAAPVADAQVADAQV